ncbi:hypothetical protein HDE_05917 [Halotydeus destructor]|nr:hypothetical protein HDE_05917 [Halotydeus destructor]
MLRVTHRLCLARLPSRHFSSGQEKKKLPEFLEVVKQGAIWTHPKIPYKIGYTDVYPETHGDVVSPDDPNMLLHYWPKSFKFVVPYFSSFRTEVKEFLSDGRHWTKNDIDRHEDLISHESTLVGRQPDKERRLYTLIYLEAIFIFDDLCEVCILSGHKELYDMAFEVIPICQAILSGSGHGVQLDPKYKEKFPIQYAEGVYMIEFSRRLHAGYVKTMTPRLLKAVESASDRSFERLKEEYKFWYGALARKEHAPLDKFISLKAVSSFFSCCNIADYLDSDLDFMSFDHPVQTLATLVCQASNDLFSYPKENDAGLNPYNMVQKSHMTDKLSVKDALITNIHRRNGYVRALELCHMVMEGPAKVACEAPLRTMAGWERYFQLTRRYGWTNIGADAEQPDPLF